MTRDRRFQSLEPSALSRRPGPTTQTGETTPPVPLSISPSRATSLRHASPGRGIPERPATSLPHRLTVSPSRQDDPPAALPFERRQCDRWSCDAAATACCVAGPEFGRMHEMRVVDFGDGGLGAVSRTPVEPGTVLSIGFAAPGRIARRGVVLRCTPCGEGYRIAVEFEARMAA